MTNQLTSNKISAYTGLCGGRIHCAVAVAHCCVTKLCDSWVVFYQSNQLTLKNAHKKITSSWIGNKSDYSTLAA